MKQVKFTGGLKIVDGVGLVREINTTLPAYVGPPSPEIDDAWEKIVHRKLPWTRVHTELIQVFHT